MKKILLGLSLFASLGLSAQVVFQENFDGNGPGVSGWTLLDVDGNASASQPEQMGIIGTWTLLDLSVFTSPAYQAQGSGLVSTSFTVPATPVSDWAISPQITIPANALLYYKCWAFDANFPDGYELRIATNGGNTVADFTTVLVTMDQAPPLSNSTQEVDLGAYAGQTVRLAWVNNSQDMFNLGLDDIMVTTEQIEIPIAYCEPSEAASVEPITSFAFGAQVFTYSNVVDDSPAYVGPTDEHTVGAIAGTTYPIVCMGNTGGNFTNYFYLYVDYDNNGIFEDTEQAYLGSVTNSTGTAPTTAYNYTVPAGTADGNYRMRLVKVYADGLLTENVSCITADFWFGQVIDYTLQVSDLSTGDFNQSAVSVYPNPAKSQLFINGGAEGIGNVKAYNMLGQLVVSANFAGNVDNNLDVSGLAKGVYTMQITTASGKTIEKKFIKE